MKIIFNIIFLAINTVFLGLSINVWFIEILSLGQSVFIGSLLSLIFTAMMHYYYEIKNQIFELKQLIELANKNKTE